MKLEEFVRLENDRLSSFVLLIEESLKGNPKVAENTQQEVMVVVRRAFEAEKEFLQEEPEEYKRLYGA